MQCSARTIAPLGSINTNYVGRKNNVSRRNICKFHFSVATWNFKLDSTVGRNGKLISTSLNTVLKLPSRYDVFSILMYVCL